MNAVWAALLNHGFCPDRAALRSLALHDPSSALHAAALASEKSPRNSGEVMKRSSQRSIWVIEKALASGETD
jgi:hypothetical protein